MLLDNAEVDKMQSSVDNAFACLPETLTTEEVRGEIAKAVVRSAGDRDGDARQFIATLIASVDHATAILASLRSR